MIILDTDVISALMLSEPDQAVVSWLDQQASESVWTTSITVYEVRFGLEILSAGTRRSRLTSAFDALLAEDLANRVLELNTSAANEAAVLAATLRHQGRSLEIRDAMISGIALARRAAVATRNVRHFELAPIPVVNPWDQ